MIKSTKVYVIEKAKGHFLLRWNDPRSGKRKERRAEGKNRQDAERQAGALEAELNAGAS